MNNNFKFVLYANVKKTKEKHPDFVGSIVIDNVKYELSAWKNISKKGNVYLAGNVDIVNGNKNKDKNNLNDISLSEDVDTNLNDLPI